MKEYVYKKLKDLFGKGFFHILLGGSLTKIVAFLSSILIIRFVTKSEYAFLSDTDNIFAYVFLVTGLGLDTAVLKFCTSNDKGKNKAYLQYAFRLGTFSEVFIILITFLYSVIFPIPFIESRPYLFSMMLYPFLYYWVCLSQSFMRAQLYNRKYAYASLIQTLVVFAGSIGLVFIIRAYSVIVARYLGACVALIYIVKCINKELAYKADIITKEEKNKFIKFGLSLLLANVFSMIMPINETFLVNNLIRETTVTANYRVANLIPQQLTFFTSAIITFYFPYFARLKSKVEQRQLSIRVGLLTIGIIIAITAVGIIASPFIIQAVYGSQYRDINQLMTSLWIMHAINASIRMLPMNILPAIGYTKFNVIMSMMSCVVHFGIDYFCISHYGVNGAVIAGCIVYASSAICYWIYLLKKVSEKVN